MVKGEKWACSNLEAGKNKPIMFITKTRDLARICEELLRRLKYKAPALENTLPDRLSSDEGIEKVKNIFRKMTSIVVIH